MKKKLLSIVLSALMITSTFTTRVFATSYETIGEIVNLAINILTMSRSSIPDDAWTNGNGGFLAKVGDSIYFTDVDDTYKYSIPTISMIKRLICPIVQPILTEAFFLLPLVSTNFLMML